MMQRLAEAQRGNPCIPARREAEATVVVLHGNCQNGPLMKKIVENALQHYRAANGVRDGSGDVGDVRWIFPSAPFRPMCMDSMQSWITRAIFRVLCFCGFVDTYNGRVRLWVEERPFARSDPMAFEVGHYHSGIVPFNEDDLQDPSMLSEVVDSLRPLIAKSVDNHKGDSSRVFLLGYSAGAQVAIRLALGHSQTLGGCVALAGFHTQPSVTLGRERDHWITPAGRLTPLLSCVAGKDICLPADFCTDSAAHIASLGCDVEIRVLTDETHQSITLGPTYLQWIVDHIPGN